jgi:hypothetical protein
MPTIKQRINITADSDIESALKSAAKRDRVSMSSKATELIRLALDIEEDFALALIARERDTPNVKSISHEKVWGKALGK